MANCTICGRELDSPADPASIDCGGDCLKCMAETGEDPAAVAKLHELAPYIRIATMEGVLAMIRKHAAQGCQDPRYAKDQCREIVSLLDHLETN